MRFHSPFAKANTEHGLKTQKQINAKRSTDPHRTGPNWVRLLRRGVLAGARTKRVFIQYRSHHENFQIDRNSESGRWGAPFMELIKITFKQWEKWNPRKDIKQPSWFAMSNRITEDDDIQTLTDSEFRAFVHLTCLASQKSRPPVVVNLDKAVRVTGIKRATFLETITKLAGLEIISSEPVREAYAIRTDDERDPNATLQDKTLQDTTGHECVSRVVTDAPPALGPERLKAIWNANCGTLAKVKAIGKRAAKASARCREFPDPEYWVSVVQRIAASDFCNGRQKGREWRASFDFLIQPDAHLKVMEGKYDNSQRSGDDTNWERVFGGGLPA